MSEPNFTSEQERLDGYVDGALDSSRAAEVEEHLASNAELRAECHELQRLHQLLSEAHLDVSPGFADRVMATLPTAPWRPVVQPWRWAVALFLLLATSGLVLVGLAQGEASASGVGLVATLGEFFVTTAVAGAGLLGASWRGVGMAVDSWLTASVPNLVVSLFLVVGLNVMLLRLLRSRTVRQSVRSDD